MKKKWLLALICLSLSLTAVCQNSANPKDTTDAAYRPKDSVAGALADSRSLSDKDKDKMAKSLQPADGKALVYILRPAGLAMLIRMNVRCDSLHIGSTKAHNFVYTMLEPGQHTLMSFSENRAKLEITVEAGKVYFVKQEVTMGFAYAETGLTLLDEKEGQKYLQKCKLAKDNVASN
jgi:hypothetical protein